MYYTDVQKQKDKAPWQRQLWHWRQRFWLGGAEKMNQEFTAGKALYDERLGCAIIEDSRHNLKLYVWPNGKCVASDARHPNMVAMSAVYWKGQLEEHNLFL